MRSLPPCTMHSVLLERGPGSWPCSGSPLRSRRDAGTTFDRSGQRLGDRHILAGRAEADGGSEISDDDLRAGYFEADDAALVPLRDELRSSVSLSLQLFGDATTNIPAGDRIVFDSNRNYPGDGRLRLLRAAGTASVMCRRCSTSTAICARWASSAIWYRRGRTGASCSICPRCAATSTGCCSSCGRATSTWPGWRRAPRSERTRRSRCSRSAFPSTATPIRRISSRSTRRSLRTSSSACRSYDASSGRRAFANYRNRTASVGDVWYSDGGASFRVRGVAENVVATDFQAQINSALSQVASRVGNVFDHLLRTVPLDTLNGHLSPEAWQTWCDATFSGSCPVPANVLAEMSAMSIANLASAEVVLPPTVDYPMEASISPLSADGVWNNPFATAIFRGAQLARVMTSRDVFASICAPTFTYCDADPTRQGCATCDFCATAPPSLSAVCDFSSELPLVYLPGDGGPRIPRSRNVAALIDMAPNLGVELSRIFNEPVDRWEEAHGTAMSYTNIAWCPSTVAGACPSGATGAIFWLANDPDGDGVPIPEQQLPHHHLFRYQRPRR